MPGLLLLLCLLALAAVVGCNLARWRVRRRVVLVVGAVPVDRLEGVLRQVLGDWRIAGAEMAVYTIAEGERGRIIRKLCRVRGVEVLDRAAALKLWRQAGIEFWRVQADGGVIRLR